MISLTRGETLTETTPILARSHVIIACSPVCDRDASRLPKPGSLQLCPSNPRDPGFIPAQRASRTRESRASLRDSCGSQIIAMDVCVSHCTVPLARGTIASYVYCITRRASLHAMRHHSVPGFTRGSAGNYFWLFCVESSLSCVHLAHTGPSPRRPGWTDVCRVGLS